MKITIYELLGLIKEGKAPEKIKYYNNRVWEYKAEHKDYYNGMWSLLENQIDVVTDYFDDEVEIIEEEKALEKLTYENAFKDNSDLEIKEILVNKINELIDEINKLKEDK